MFLFPSREEGHVSDQYLLRDGLGPTLYIIISVNPRSSLLIAMPPLGADGNAHPAQDHTTVAIALSSSLGASCNSLLHDLTLAT